MAGLCVLANLAPGAGFEFSYNNPQEIVGDCFECIRKTSLKACEDEAAIADELGTADAFYGVNQNTSATETVTRTVDGAEVAYHLEMSEPISDDPDDIFYATSIGRAAIECNRILR